MIEMTYKL